MRLGGRRIRLLFLLAVLSFSEGCAEECIIVPTSVELSVDHSARKAPAAVVVTAKTTLGSSSCGPEPTEILAYRWRLDGVPLEAEGAQIVLELTTPGSYVVEVRVEDDLGAELPSVGRATVRVY
ncbi:MAG: PKD domain-containing protein [Polyangiaceae bacterium]|nr:PKD domain-containing protein [Polyangiaceae bacterium]